MRRIKEIYVAFKNGDEYTNEEALILMDAFKKAADACMPLGEIFNLAFKEANQNYIRLYDICKDRGLK